MRFRVIRTLFRELTGRSHADFADALVAQLEACLQGAEIAHLLTRGEIDNSVARARMTEIEHVGDKLRGELVERLANTIVTPIDREDLFRLSRSIDDVLDNLRDYAREVDLLNAAPELGGWAGLTEAITNTIRSLKTTIEDLAEGPERLESSLLRAKKSCNDVRKRYQRAVADLLSADREIAEQDPRSIMRQRELLRRLDIVGLRMGEAADALADGLMKRNL